MKKIAGILVLCMLVFLAESVKETEIIASAVSKKSESKIDNKSDSYKYPDFYRGIYLTVNNGTDIKKLSAYVKRARQCYINTMVIDVQVGKKDTCAVSSENVQLLLKNGIHPIARIVMFPDGLKTYPCPQELLNNRIKIARDSCEKGFKEIQFDYIRFYDSGKNRHVSLKERYEFVEGTLRKMKQGLTRYNVRIAADIFGRIPLNKKDQIGQRMEGLDAVVDVICPMAYPSHYTWSKKLQSDPYFTVYITSKKAEERTKQAAIVAYIQAFKMRMRGIPFDRYIADQIKAVHDAKIKGFLLWNASQQYDIPMKVTKDYYEGRIPKRSRSSDDES